MERKLASIQRIIDIQPIEGADKIERLTLLGWHIVASKSENHKIGDLVCYIETDSKVPALPIFEFLKDRKYIVKTIKLRKQVSQGLVIPLRKLEKNFNIDISKLKEGDNITKLLGITKYDPESEKEVKLFGSTKGVFPSWIHKTNEDRIQCMPNEFYEIVNDPTKENKILFDSTEKLDGQSATYFIKKTKKFKIFNKYEFGICSRNLRLKNPDNSSYWTIVKQLDLENVLKSLLNRENAKTIVLQGEICGEGIQKNKYNIKGYKFFVFNLIINGTKYRTCEIQELLNFYNIDTVPILDKEIELKNTIDEMVKDSEGKSKLYKTEREGKIWRDIDNNISFKVINPKFLLKNDE